MTHECPDCGAEVKCDCDKCYTEDRLSRQRCSFCHQPYTNLVEHLDSCDTLAEVRKVIAATSHA